MIDPLVAVIAYLLEHPDLASLGGRIAAKHKFAMGAQDDATMRGWPTPSQALQLSYAPGEPPDLSGAIGRVRLDGRCYGASQADALSVAAALLGICDAFQRTPIGTSEGAALIYWIVPDDSPAFDRDPDTTVDFVSIPLRAAVARDAVS